MNFYLWCDKTNYVIHIASAVFAYSSVTRTHEVFLQVAVYCKSSNSMIYQVYRPTTGFFQDCSGLFVVRNNNNSRKAILLSRER